MKRRGFREKLKELLPQFGKENIIYFDESGFKAHCYRDTYYGTTWERQENGVARTLGV